MQRRGGVAHHTQSVSSRSSTLARRNTTTPVTNYPVDEDEEPEGHAEGL